MMPSSVYISDTASGYGYHLTEAVVARLHAQENFSQLASLRQHCEPTLFAVSITERAHLSHVAMAMGSMTVDERSCDIFESTATAKIAAAFATIAAVSAGRSKSVNAEHLAKV